MLSLARRVQLRAAARPRLRRRAAEIGLPHGEIPLALFSFNVGVELGQLAFIAVVLTLLRLARFLVPAVPGWAVGAAGYAIGSVAAFWVFVRPAAAA